MTKEQIVEIYDDILLKNVLIDVGSAESEEGRVMGFLEESNVLVISDTVCHTTDYIDGASIKIISVIAQKTE
jgi:hypothetical protein